MNATQHNQYYKEPPESDFVEFFKKNALALTLQGVGIIVLLANLWLAAQLRPLAESIREVSANNDRQDQKIDKLQGISERFIVVEEKVKNIEANTQDIASDVKSLLLNNRNSSNNGANNR